MSALDRVMSTALVPRGERAPARSTSVQASVPGGVVGPVGGWYGGKNTALPEQFSAAQAVSDAYFANMYVWRCVDAICKGLLKLEFSAVYDVTKAQRANNASALAQLFGPNGKPNPDMSSAELIRYMATQWVLTGKTALLPAYGPDGSITALYPMAVHKLTPIPDDSPTSMRLFKGYQYGAIGSPGARTYGLDQVMYMWRKSPLDFRQPESVVQAAQLPIAVAKMIDVYDYVFLKNDGVPATIVTTQPFVEAEERRAFRDQFVASMTGYQNAGKTMFVETSFDVAAEGPASVNNSISIQRMALSQKESQQSETRDAKISDICVAFGVPLSVLGDTRLSKFQNADMDYRTFLKESVVPVAKELAAAINLAVAPRLGLELALFDTTNMRELQPPKTFAPENALALIQSNVITRDEFRADLGLPTAVEAGLGDVIYPATAVTPSGTKVEEVDDQPALPAAVPGSPPLLAAARARRAARTAPVLETRSEQRHAGPDGHVPIPGGHVHDGSTPQHIQRAFESMLSSTLNQLFAEQSEQAQARLAGRRGRKQANEAASNVQALFDAAYWEARTVAVLAPIAIGIAEVRARKRYEDTDEPIATSPVWGGMTYPAVANKLGKDITAQTIAALGQLIEAQPDDLLARVGSVFDDGLDGAINLARQQLLDHSLAGARCVDRKTVTQALLDIHAGRITTEAAIAALTEGAA